MALAKRSLVKDPHADYTTTSLDDHELAKRKKRCDENFSKHDEKLYLPQKKRVLGPPLPPPSVTAGLTRLPAGIRQNSDDQDDETLIRETQAALKSLSGSWPDSRGSMYKISDTDENPPPFQNLFEDKNNGERKMSPTISTTSMLMVGNGAENTFDYGANGKYPPHQRDYKFSQKYRRDDYLPQRLKEKHIDGQTKCPSQYQAHDFTELVDDSSTDLQMDMANGGAKDDMRREKEYHRTVDGSFGSVPSQRPTFSQSSAFKPLAMENRKNGIMMSMAYPSDSTYAGYSHQELTQSNQLDGGGVDKVGGLKMHIKEEDPVKSIDSPDSKQYTILQPAGVGSKAASVMQDIAREGVVSVAAVSSTSSPGLGNVSSTTTVGDKAGYERAVASFSPGSMNRGEFTV